MEVPIEAEAARRHGILEKKCARGPVSRVLSGGRTRLDGHSSRRRIAPPLKQPTRATRRNCPICRPYSVLLPVGFTVPAPVAGSAVGSYPTLSLSHSRSPCDLLSVALSLGLPPPGVTRHRYSVEPGLSSPRLRRPQPSSPLAGPM